MNPSRILIVDDEPNVRFVIERALRRENYQLESAAGGAEALARLAEAPYDLMLLDLRMDGVDGLQVLEAARARDPDLAVIILTAYSSVDSAVAALRLGAFDYLYKPADPAAIRERVRAGLARRAEARRRNRVLGRVAALRDALDGLEGEEPAGAPAADARFVRAGGLVIDAGHRSATLDGRWLALSTSEFDLLAALVRAAPEPLGARDLARQALGVEATEVEARELVKWHVHNLRAKLEPDPRYPRYLLTVRYRGYLWAGDAPVALG
jgi:DNA-binding response OmpR family regulator